MNWFEAPSDTELRKTRKLSVWNRSKWGHCHTSTFLSLLSHLLRTQTTYNRQSLQFYGNILLLRNAARWNLIKWEGYIYKWCRNQRLCYALWAVNGAFLAHFLERTNNKRLLWGTKIFHIYNFKIKLFLGNRLKCPRAAALCGTQCVNYCYNGIVTTSVYLPTL